MKRFLRRGVAFAKETLSDFAEDEAVTRAAALAYYAGLSFAPLLLLAISVTGLAGKEATDELVAEVRRVMGPEAGSAVTLVADSTARRPGSGWWGATVAVVMLVLSAAGAFGQLQDSLNRIWDVRARPGLGFKGWVRRRLLSMGMVLAVVFLLVVSLVVSTALAFLFGGRAGWLWEVANAVVSLAAFTGLFALVFKYVPDVEVPWHVLRIGAVLTAVLFLLGKTAIGVYLGRSTIGSAYGAAGSLIVLLVWVYYCSIVVFLGAEATQTQARLTGLHLVPNRYAVPVEDPKGSLGRAVS